MGGVQSDKWEDMSLVGVVTRRHMQAGVELGKIVSYTKCKRFLMPVVHICKMPEWD